MVISNPGFRDNVNQISFEFRFWLIQIITIFTTTINIDSVVFILKVIWLTSTPIDVSFRFPIWIGEYVFPIDIIDIKPNMFVK